MEMSAKTGLYIFGENYLVLWLARKWKNCAAGALRKHLASTRKRKTLKKRPWRTLTRSYSPPIAYIRTKTWNYANLAPVILLERRFLFKMSIYGRYEYFREAQMAQVKVLLLGDVVF